MSTVGPSTSTETSCPCYSEPDDERTIFHLGGWDLDGLDAAAPQLTSDLTNDYTLDDHPELQIFEE